jgi:hypothetical protein
MIPVEAVSTYPSKEFSKALPAVCHEFLRFLSVWVWKEDFSLPGLRQFFPLVSPFIVYKLLNSILNPQL